MTPSKPSSDSQGITPDYLRDIKGITPDYSKPIEADKELEGILADFERDIIRVHDWSHRDAKTALLAWRDKAVVAELEIWDAAIKAGATHGSSIRQRINQLNGARR